MFAKVPKLSFNNGLQIPIVGLGTYAVSLIFFVLIFL